MLLLPFCNDEAIKERFKVFLSIIKFKIICFALNVFCRSKKSVNLAGPKRCKTS